MQVLIEGSRPDELGYHFTNIKGLANILKTDYMLATNDEEDTNTKYPTFSYTRKKDGMYYRNLRNIDAVRLVLDIDKLSTKYKIVPFSWSHIKKNSANFEYEERVQCVPMKDHDNLIGLPEISKYLTEITLNSSIEQVLSGQEYYEIDGTVYSEFKYLLDLCEDIEKKFKYLENTVKLKIRKDSGCLLKGDASEISDYLYDLFLEESIPQQVSVKKLLRGTDKTAQTKYFRRDSDSATFAIPNTLDEMVKQYQLLNNFSKEFAKVFSYVNSELIDNIHNRADFLKRNIEDLDVNTLYGSISESKMQHEYIRVQNMLKELSILSLKDGTSVTDLNTFRKYLEEKNIKLGFLEGSKLVVKPHVFKSDIGKEAQRFIRAAKDLIKRAFVLQKKLKVMQSEVRTILRRPETTDDMAYSSAIKEGIELWKLKASEHILKNLFANDMNKYVYLMDRPAEWIDGTWYRMAVPVIYISVKVLSEREKELVSQNPVAHIKDEFSSLEGKQKVFLNSLRFTQKKIGVPFSNFLKKYLEFEKKLKDKVLKFCIMTSTGLKFKYNTYNNPFLNAMYGNEFFVYIDIQGKK